LKLLFQPIMQLLCTQLRLPQVVGAFLVIVTLFAAVSALAFAVSGPASVWVQKAPEVLPALKQKLTVLRKPLDYLQKSFNEVKEVASPSDGAEVPTLTVKQASPIGSNFAFATARILERFLATLIFLFFLLASGDRLLRSFIEVLPRFADKRLAVEIATEIQRQIGGYLFTITVMNALVGVVTGLTMWACGLGDPILWGVGAFALNYVPILGPLLGVGILGVVGILALEWPWQALLPAGIYLIIHIAEGETITPMILARRFTLNPVLVMISLFFWYMLWGVPGALLAVPFLAVAKIVCDRVEPLHPAGHILGG
jgi:predicted PurR-regulated permease PerM